MGWATAIREPAQVEYRLANKCGCDLEHSAQVEYRLAGESDMRWIGSGLVDVGLEAGGAVVPDQARRLMQGQHPHSGEQLVAPKQELDPRGKLPASLLIEALREVATVDAMTVQQYLERPGLVARFGRAERGVAREGEAHLLPIGDIERLAAAAGIDHVRIYGAEAVAAAEQWRGAKVSVGVMGVDLTVDLPKSLSTAYAVASPATAALMEKFLKDSVDEATQQLEGWTAYSMAGHHGDGQRAERVETTGFMGWTVLHRSARPMDDTPGDPHLHIHAVLANMALGEDGKWRTVASGTQDLHRHARTLNELAEALNRAKWIEHFGASFTQDPTTNAWELDGIPTSLRSDFSRRHREVLALAGEGASSSEQKAAARASAHAKVQLEETDVRTQWRERAGASLGGDQAVDAMLAEALPGPGGGPSLSSGGGPRMPSAPELAAAVWEGQWGLVAGRKTVTRAHVLAAVAAAVPYLLRGEELEALADIVLEQPGHAVRLADDGRAYQANRQRYTHTSVLEAESILVETAMARMDVGAAVVTPEAAQMAMDVFEATRGFALDEEQRQVVLRLLTAGHGVDAVLGVAGSGKTTLLQAAQIAWRAAQIPAAGACTAAVTAANLTAETGISSRTVAAWVADIRKTGGRDLDALAGGVLLIDEAPMVDDRELALLLRATTDRGIKLVAIGDPLQLQAIGIGGGFARIHQLVGGLALRENRRQRDSVERLALQVWRTGKKEQALQLLAGHGRVHATDTAQESMVEMLEVWDQARVRWQGDPHLMMRELLVLASRTSDVELLTGAARAMRRQAGDLGPEVRFALAGGGRLDLAVGDLVRVRQNDYRSRRGNGDQVDVLNGYRGVVLAADRRRGALVEWVRLTSDGERREQAWISAAAISKGSLGHGYAMTIHAAQGSTATTALVYGPGADSFGLYPGLSRAREATHLWLPLGVVEDEVTRARLGDPRSEAERVDRAVRALAQALAQDRGDRMVMDELSEDAPAVPRQAEPVVDRARQAQREVEQRILQQQQREQDAAVTPWQERPQGSVSSKGLPGLIEKTRTLLEEGRVKSAQEQAAAAAMAAVVGTDRAPAAAQIAKDASVLVQAQALDQAAKQLRDQADKLAAQQRAMYGENHVELREQGRLRSKAETKTVKFTGRKRSTLKGATQLAKSLNERTEAIGKLRKEETEIRAEASVRDTDAGKLRKTLNAKPGESDVDLMARRVGEADATDRRALAKLQKSAAALQAAVERGTRVLGQLEGEAAIRAGLSPAVERTETHERRVAQVNRDSRERAEQSTKDAARAQERRWQPPTQSQSGPSIGLG
jgi:conjugative relaxase-like TrwC/TraI family protein